MLGGRKTVMITNTRALYFPYCIRQRKDGAWLILNRNYKPIGATTSDWVDYDAHPAEACIAKITPQQAQKISYGGPPEYGDTIYLYSDGCVPTDSKKNMDSYLARLALVMKLKTVREKKLGF